MNVSINKLYSDVAFNVFVQNNLNVLYFEVVMILSSSKLVL